MNKSIVMLVVWMTFARVPAHAGPQPSEKPAPATTSSAAPVVNNPQSTVEVLNRANENARRAKALRLRQEQERVLAQRAMLIAQRVPAKPPAWLLPLLITACALSLVSAAAQPFWHSRSSVPSQAVLQRVETISEALKELAEEIRKPNIETVKTIDAVHDATMERITALFREVGDVKEQIARIADRPAEATDGDVVRLEQDALAEHWKAFREKNGLPHEQENPWDRLLHQLPALVPAELRPSLDAVMAPHREHRVLIQKIKIIPSVISGQMPLASEAAELKRAHDLTQLLIAAQNDGDSLLNFPFQEWVTGTFLPFADLYLQNYQKALLEKRDGDLHKGMSVIREILRMAAVEPIDLTLGETRFDSARHIGRFTSSDPHYADGVITGVVRNGFMESGRQVIRQPEVVVNRVR